MQCQATGCKNPAKLSKRGRKGKYCSDLCRLRAFRSKESSGETKFRETKFPDIEFYCGINAKTWAHHPVTPGRFACIAPTYGKKKETKMMNQVTVPKTVEAVLMDSGAFSDKTDERLSFEEALHRQVSHAYRFGYVQQVGHIASYDLLIDEEWDEGKRRKVRWSHDKAEMAIAQTVLAAQYLASQRRSLQGVFGHPVSLALSAQGVDVEQYMRCASQLVPLLERGDVFALGGWCITGLAPRLILPSFCEIMTELIPYLGQQKVDRLHIWGCIFPEALGYLLYLCDQHAIRLSTDSSGPSRCPVTGDWGYGSWRDNSYEKPFVLETCKTMDEHGRKAPSCLPGTFCQGLERIRHVQATQDWLAHFREREAGLYRPIEKPVYKQLFLLEDAS